MTIRLSDLRVGPIRLFPPRRWAIAIGALGLLMTAMAAGQTAKDQRSARSQELILFDGKSLDGWKKTDFAHAGDVKVEGAERTGDKLRVSFPQGAGFVTQKVDISWQK